MKKPAVLLVSYHFYPSPEVGAKRPSETAYHLAQSGYDVTVIRATGRSQPADGDWPGFAAIHLVSVKIPRKIITACWIKLKHLIRGESADDGAEPEAAQDASVAKADGESVNKSLGAAQWLRRQLLAVDTLFQGDKLWMLKVVLRTLILRFTKRYDVVIASGPPMAGYICGLAASRIFAAPLILDFRDPWHLHGDSIRKTDIAGHPLANWENSFAQRCIAGSSLITVAAPGIGRHIEEQFDASHQDIQLVRNGFDEVAVIDEPPPMGCLRILYAGTLYWNRNPFPFMEALAEIADSPGIERNRIRFTMVGYCEDWEGVAIRPWLAEQGMEDIVKIEAAVDFATLREMTTASNVLINFAQGQPRQIPAKSYEYLAARRDLLIVCGENDDVAGLFREAGIGEIVNPDDTAGVKAAILAMYEKYVGGRQAESAPIDIQPFSRRAQVEIFAQQLRNTLNL